jgi:mono/diheme cytochrome c family protein
MLAALAFGEPSLKFQVSGETVSEITLSRMRAEVGNRKVTLSDPHHGGKTKTYSCVPMPKLMELAFGAGWTTKPQTEAVLTAIDGYASQTSADKLGEEGGCLAYEDEGGDGWEPIGRKKADPGPFYLVWTKENQSAKNEYAWPWQLMSVNLISFEERFPEVVPKGEKKGSAAHRGYMIFRGQCLRCHSINQQGGKIGPDLNAPKSVVAYREKKWLLGYIKKPSDTRYTEMPDHSHLSQRDLDDLWAYFSVKAKQPEKGGW